MKIWFPLFGLLACTLPLSAADKPDVYLSIKAKRHLLDDEAHKLLGTKYTIHELKDTPDYTPPKAKAGRLPALAHTPEGKPLGGEAVVLYVVTPEGLAQDPQFAQCSDDRLKPFIEKVMKEWRLQPAQWKGKTISTISSQEFSFASTPTEFTPQILEPLGGKIARPKGWHYTESHNDTSFTWILSKEDAKDRPYTTGLRIQAISRVQELSGKSGETFVKEFIAGKKKAADRVIGVCEEKSQGPFTRICLETEEGPYRIMYSLFWGTENLDMVVVSIAGTTPELWETYAPAFNRMNAFKLIDLKHLKK
ncbi:hypothetical protein GCM10023213_40540 [Prosthecobacter algae]|uniref:Energy transducer TonB n=1 Tax=Prosthecobacter algae TaxID=1144682 RepID=A0ABP9PP62_9BACT